MAVSTIAQYTGGGIKIPCILKEGNITYAAKFHMRDGMHDEGVTFASPLAKGDWVILSTDTANTYDATEGNPVVIPIAAGTSIIGQIISEPEWRSAPPGSSQSTWSTMLSSKYYRVATVEWFGLAGIAKAVFVGSDTGNVAPGDVATLKVDASASVALTGGVVTLSVSDVASGGNLLAFHYVAKGTSTVSMLVGFLGSGVVIQA